MVCVRYPIEPSMVFHRFPGGKIKHSVQNFYQRHMVSEWWSGPENRRSPKRRAGVLQSRQRRVAEEPQSMETYEESFTQSPLPLCTISVDYE